MDTLPYGYCQCGCGEKTKPTPVNNLNQGLVKGKPYKYLAGHSGRKFWLFDNTHTVNPETGCWNWLGAVSTNGYGLYKNSLAHRIYYIHYTGDISPGLELDHLCRNRSCVNPSHLEPVTRAVNAQRGKNIKLNPDKVREIRRLSSINYSHTLIAEIFSVSLATVSMVVSRQRWANVD